jgi:DNA-binding NarL/FixJ family response regulator
VEVVRMVTRGLHNKEVAEKLGITEGTVKIHLH